MFAKYRGKLGGKIFLGKALAELHMAFGELVKGQRKPSGDKAESSTESEGSLNGTNHRQEREPRRRYGGAYCRSRSDASDKGAKEHNAHTTSRPADSRGRAQARKA